MTRACRPCRVNVHIMKVLLDVIDGLGRRVAGAEKPDVTRDFVDERRIASTERALDIAVQKGQCLIEG